MGATESDTPWEVGLVKAGLKAVWVMYLVVVAVCVICQVWGMSNWETSKHPEIDIGGK